MNGVDISRVEKATTICSLQDSGRHGFRHLAIPQSGCLDAYSQRLANYMVGNTPEKAVIEIISGTFVCLVLENISIGVCGIGVTVEVNGIQQNPLQTIFIKKGEVLSVQAQLGYLAVSNGFEGTAHFGSVSTYPMAKLGGISGSNLKKGNTLKASVSAITEKSIPQELLPQKSSVIRVIKGPEFIDVMSGFEEIQWTISNQSNRVGIRLSGNKLETKDIKMLSVPVFPGTIQLTSDGTPIVLLADAQTTGGYPRIAQVIKADLSRAGRLISGGSIRFKFVEIDEAREIYHRQESFLNHALRQTI